MGGRIRFNQRAVELRRGGLYGAVNWILCLRNDDCASIPVGSDNAGGSTGIAAGVAVHRKNIWEGRYPGEVGRVCQVPHVRRGGVGSDREELPGTLQVCGC